MKNLASIASILIVLFLIAWVFLNLFGVVDRAPDNTAVVLALVAIAAALCPSLPSLPKIG